MQEEFPDLKLVRGHAVLPAMVAILQEEKDLPEEEQSIWLDPGNGHWWLETDEGLVVDPTAAQFEDAELAYWPFNESKADTLPTGKCPNCGSYCFNGRDLCSEECEVSYVAYLNAEVASYRR